MVTLLFPSFGVQLVTAITFLSSTTKLEIGTERLIGFCSAVVHLLHFNFYIFHSFLISFYVFFARFFTSFYPSVTEEWFPEY